jgi:plasmid stabilization system protein ParE
LEQFPNSGREIPEFGRPDLREVILGSYRIVHRVRDDEVVEVLAVIHSARLLTPDLVPKQEP